MRIAKIFANNLHFGMTLLLLQSIAPSLRAAGIPLKFDWAQLYYLFGATGLMFLSLVSNALPGVDWFASLVLVFSFNQGVIALKPHSANDALLNRIDSWLLFGATVPDIAHRAYQALPLEVLSFLDLLYFAMFAQVGAAMILLEYRYVVDLIGGMAIAAMAILLND